MGHIGRTESPRAALLSDPCHCIVFHYTPKHTFGMNQWIFRLMHSGAKTDYSEGHVQIGHL